LPDPNTFDGDICIRRRGASAEEPVASTTARLTRGTGVLDLATAIRERPPHPAAGALGLHVLAPKVALRGALAHRALVPAESPTGWAVPLPGDWDPIAATSTR